MKQRFYLLILFLVLGQIVTNAQVGQFPITANLIVNPPSTTYLSDYSQLGSTRLQVNLFQNDFNEPDIDVRLKITIEGSGVTLETNPNWVAPIITTNPGLNVLTGSDLEGYLNPQNMIVNGIDPEELGENGGGLPEGLYQFCVEVYNFPRTDVDIAAPSCFTTTLLKNYPPILVFPSCGEVVPVNPGQQNIQFQWQSNADANIMVEYLLTVAEVPEGMNPNDVLNGAQTPVLDEEIIMSMNTFQYGPSFPELDIGKTYAYRVQVRDILGLTTFENDGFSEVCTFDYGFSANGPVPVTGPDDAFLAEVDNQATFTWNRPQEVLPSQELYYKLKVVEMSNGQQRQNAIQFNSAFYEETTEVLPFGGNLVLPPELYPLPAEKSYAWQITAWSDASGTEVKVGESEVRILYTAPAVPRFKTGSPFEIAIEVIGLTKNQDLGDGDKIISGTGTAIVRESGETHQIEFADIKVTPYADSWQLAEGEIISPVQSEFTVDIDNSGEESDDGDYNGNLEFHVENFVFTTTDFHLEGRMKWDFPHATTEPNGAVVQSVFSRVFFNEYQVLDNYILLEDHTFDLLEPNAFTINYTAGQETSGSRFNVTESTCTLHLYGSLSPNNNIVDVEDERIKYNFEDANNPFYWETTDASADKDIRVVPNATMQLDAQHTIFDLSDIESPSRAPDEAWMGIYFQSWKMQFPTDFDGSNQLTLFEHQTYDFDDSQDDFLGFVDANGLDLIFNKTFAEGSGPRAAFNTFPDDLMEIEFIISDNSVEESFIDGFLVLPMISDTEQFTYHVPFDNEGLQVSFLDDDLIDREVVFNADKPDLKLVMTIRQAVFEENERLSFTIDMNWEDIDASIASVPDLKLWGNGALGFNTPNGKAGISNLEASLKDTYEMTLDEVVAGFHNGKYGLGFAGSIIIGDEGSGIAGTSDSEPPSVVLVSEFSRENESITGGEEEGDNWFEAHSETGVEHEEARLAIEIPIVVTTPAIDMGANLIVMYDDPEWGTAFYGIGEAVIKKPKKFGLDLKVIVGELDDTKYWFVEAGFIPDKKEVEGANGKVIKVASKIKGLKDKTKSEKKESVSLTVGSVEITEIRGRVYYHMTPDKDAMMSCDIELDAIGQIGYDETIEEGMNFDVSGINLPDVLGAFSMLEFNLLFSLPNFDWNWVWPSLPSINLYWPSIELAFPDIDWPSLRLQFPNFDWPDLFAMFPDFDWPTFMLSLPDIDWPSIVINFPDLWDLLLSLDLAWPSLGLPDLSLPDFEIPNIDLAFNEVDIDYVIDPEVSYGGFLFVAAQDKEDGGEKFKGEGALEIEFASSGGLRRIGFKLEVGIVNKDPEDGEIKDAEIYGIGCIQYSTSPATFIADIAAQSKSKKFCAQGYLHLHFSPSIKRVFLGTRENRLGFITGANCSGNGYEGWFKYDQSPGSVVLGIGLGMGYHYNGEYDVDIGACDIEFYASAYARSAIFTDFQVSPSFTPLTAGVEFSVYAAIGADFGGWLCPFGDRKLAEIYLGGDLAYYFDQKLIEGRVSGKFKVAVFRVGFKTDFSHTFG